MKFLILTFVAIAAAQYQETKPDDYPPAPPPQYPGPQYPAPQYPAPQYPAPYPDYPDRDGGFRKLRDLNGENLIEAEIRYFRRNGEHYAVISCPRASSVPPTDFIWVVADAHRPSPPTGFPAGVTVLAGGVNTEYVAKFDDGKWEGADFSNDDKQRFRKVACFVSTISPAN